MKRLHVHVHVEEIETAIPFYIGLFGAEPSVRQDDYAKWRLDDPAVNFAISLNAAAKGISHLGIEAGDENELADIRGGFAATGSQILDEEGVSCCYAKGNKSWVQDPAGIPWEAFHTFDKAAQLASDFTPDLPPEVIEETTSKSLKPDNGEICCGS